MHVYTYKIGKRIQAHRRTGRQIDWQLTSSAYERRSLQNDSRGHLEVRSDQSEAGAAWLTSQDCCPYCSRRCCCCCHCCWGYVDPVVLCHRRH